MKIFAYEYGSGGGLFDRTMRPPLVYQGDFMLCALISDLTRLPDIEVITTREPRLPALNLPESVLVVSTDGLTDNGFNHCLRASDAVWPVAPECAGILERLSRKIVRNKRILLGSRASAVRVASSRLLTGHRLARAGVRVIDTYLPHDDLPGDVGAWVVKSDDGVGFHTTQIFHSAKNALDWINESHEKQYVLQPFLHGKPCSLSLLCCRGDAHLLSCDEQRFAVMNSQFHYLGTSVNSIRTGAAECHRLAGKIAKAIPGLWGYVSVDFILTESGPVVLGIYPRLTMSYAGLHASIGCNPAGLVLDLLQKKIDIVPASLNKVVVNVDAQTFSVN
ncbi:ATP-grasp domain-containing protein [Noviherbaspirillum sp. Root189]|uniref:ATP-grasp domain-containing protein n=1 Tax=Noviherbaspirillum sp. Root189 TaxID=1736487 RepID=UPI00138F0A18|nr:ATP-grasp domain-containing protein [Noviherbaspirillum sp. Root189]